MQEALPNAPLLSLGYIYGMQYGRPVENVYLPWQKIYLMSRRLYHFMQNENGVFTVGILDLENRVSEQRCRPFTCFGNWHNSRLGFWELQEATR